MKYFTRELAEAVGRGDARAFARWQRTLSRYERHRNAVAAGASRSARSLVLAAFHDCMVGQVYLEPAQVTLMLSGTRYWLASRKKTLCGMHRLAFRGVTVSTLNVQHVGRSWGYEEVDVNDGGYELRVLLNDNFDEFLLRFQTVTIRSTPRSE